MPDKFAKKNNVKLQLYSLTFLQPLNIMSKHSQWQRDLSTLGLSNNQMRYIIPKISALLKNDTNVNKGTLFLVELILLASIVR